MADLFAKSWQVSIGEIDISALDLTFQIKKSTKRSPNTCTVTVHNLSDSRREEIKSARRPLVQVRAGYRDENSLLFVGNARRQFQEIQELDTSLTVEARDKGNEYASARVSQSYAPGTRVVTVMADLVDALNIDRGNLSEFNNLTLGHGGSTFPDGFVSQGQAHRVLSRLVRGAGLRWSAQNGALQLLRRGRPLQTQAVLLSPSSGLLGSPTREDKGLVTAVSLIQPGLDPGRRVQLESRFISGTYEVKAVQYDGDTAADTWDATLTLKPINA